MEQLLYGTWLFVSMLYNGVIMEPPNPNLKIVYEFYSDGTNRLHYHREGEKGSCDRLALYEFDGKQIYQQVTWTAPHNADFCAQDPDMQLGNVTKTAASIVEGQFHLSLRMGEDSVIFVWDRQTKRP